MIHNKKIIFGSGQKQADPNLRRVRLSQSMQTLLLAGTIVGASATAAGDTPALDSAPYVEAVHRFADTVLEHGRDTYGEVHTPLFVDGLQVETFEPVKWKWKDGSDWVMCNISNQQVLFRVLDGLSGLTGETKYRQAAEEAVAYSLDHLMSPESGLMFWGGHTAWDLEGEKPVGTLIDKQKGNGRIMMMHELKVSQPDFEMMYRLRPEATEQLMSAIWGAHVVNWATLDFNRHGRTNRSAVPDWDATFDEQGQVPFATESGNLSFAGAATIFLRSSTMLGVLADNDKALSWGRRMVHQWQRAKHPDTGLSGGQLSWRVGHDRAQDALQHAYPQINEANLLASYHVSGRYRQLIIAQLQSAETLLGASGKYADLGREYLSWAVDDLKIIAVKGWDRSTGTLPPMMTDGTPIDPTLIKPGYYEAENFNPVKVSGLDLRVNAMAYRLSGDKDLWPTIRDMAGILGVGDVGGLDGSGRHLTMETRSYDWHVIYAMIELYRVTSDRAFLTVASQIANNLLTLQSESGLFPRPAYSVDLTKSLNHAFGEQHTHMPKREYARTGDVIPLALLYLAAAIEDRIEAVPQPLDDQQYFHCPYFGPLEDYQKKRNDRRTYDWLVFYGPNDISLNDGDSGAYEDE